MAWDWDVEFKKEFSQQIKTEKEHATVPVYRWLAAGKGRSKANPSGEERKWWEENGPIMSARWEAFLDEHPDWTPWVTPDDQLGIETPLEFHAGAEKVKVIPDRIYDTPEGLVLVDLKTGGRKPDGGYQLPIQEMALDVLYGRRIHKSYYWMARKGELVESSSPVVYDRATMEWVFATARQQVEEGVFMPNPGSQCARCDVRKFCKVVGGELPG